jgi:hypothetical protein
MLEDKYVSYKLNDSGLDIVDALQDLSLTLVCLRRYIGLALAVTSTMAIGEACSTPKSNRTLLI